MSSLEKSLSSDEALHDKEQFPIDIFPNEIINIRSSLFTQLLLILALQNLLDCLDESF